MPLSGLMRRSRLNETIVGAHQSRRLIGLSEAQHRESAHLGVPPPIVDFGTNGSVQVVSQSLQNLFVFGKRGQEKLVLKDQNGRQSTVGNRHVFEETLRYRGPHRAQEVVQKNDARTYQDFLSDRQIIYD